MACALFGWQVVSHRRHLERIITGHAILDPFKSFKSLKFAGCYRSSLRNSYLFSDSTPPFSRHWVGAGFGAGGLQTGWVTDETLPGVPSHKGRGD